MGVGKSQRDKKVELITLPASKLTKIADFLVSRNSSIYNVPVSNKFKILDIRDINIEDLGQLGDKEEILKGAIIEDINQDVLIK